jgi:hypothetical protein
MPSSRFLSGRRASDRPSLESFIVFHPEPTSSNGCGSGAGNGGRGRGRDGDHDRIMVARLAAKAEASSRKAEAERMLAELSSKEPSSVAARAKQIRNPREVISKVSSGSIHSGSGSARTTRFHNPGDPRDVISKGSSGSIHIGSGGATMMRIHKRREVISKGSSDSIRSGSGGARTTQIHNPRDPREFISMGSYGSMRSGSGGTRTIQTPRSREVTSKGRSGSVHGGSGNGIRGRGRDEDDDRLISALLLAKAEAESKRAEAERMLVGIMRRDKEGPLKRANAARATRGGVENVAHAFAAPPPLGSVMGASGWTDWGDDEPFYSLRGSDTSSGAREQLEAYGRSHKPCAPQSVRFSKTSTRLTFDDNSENVGVRANQHTFVSTLAPTPSVVSSIDSNSSRVSKLSSRLTPKIILGKSSKDVFRSNIVKETSRFKSNYDSNDPAPFPEVIGEQVARRFDSNYSNESALFPVAIGERSTRLNGTYTANDLIVSNSDSLPGSTSDTCEDYGSVASNVVSCSTSGESEVTGGRQDFWFFGFLYLKNMFNCASSIQQNDLYPESIHNLPTGESFVTEGTECTKGTKHTELTESTDRAVAPLCFI